MAPVPQDTTGISRPVAVVGVPEQSEVVEGIVDGWYRWLDHVGWVVGELVLIAATAADWPLLGLF